MTSALIAQQRTAEPTSYEYLFTGTQCRLVPVGPQHYDFLRTVEITRLGPWWRSRGSLQSPEDFVRRIWNGTLLQCLATGVTDGAPLYWLQCYSYDQSNETASLAIARLGPSSVSLRGASGVAGFVEYCFAAFSLRKLYLEVAEPNLSLFGSAIGPLFVEEGRLREHVRHGSSYVDLVLMALWRDLWDESVLKSHLLDRL